MTPPPPDPTSDLLGRFFKKVHIQPGCWEWTGARQSRGYGRFGIGPRGRMHTYLAHRLTWTWLVGAIPDGLTVDHLCMNKGCQNPMHMELVTRSTNSSRGNILRGTPTVPAAAMALRVAS